jgi:hypothetical protein
VQIVCCSRTRLCDHPHGLGQSGSPSSAYQNELMAALLRTIARHPVLAFMVIGLGTGFLTAAIRPIADAEVFAYGLPPHGFVGGLLGVGVGAFVVTGAIPGTTALLILLGAACAGASRCGGIWSHCLPCRSARH